MEETQIYIIGNVEDLINAKQAKYLYFDLLGISLHLIYFPDNPKFLSARTVVDVVPQIKNFLNFNSSFNL